MSKCLEICKEIWRSLSLVWWNFSQVWSQKLWFFDSAIFECLHNTWHSRDLVTTSSVIIHSEDEKIVQIFIICGLRTKLTLPNFCEKCRQINRSPFPMVWNFSLEGLLGKFCENVYNVLIELEVRIPKKCEPRYWFSMKLIKLRAMTDLWKEKANFQIFCNF